MRRLAIIAFAAIILDLLLSQLSGEIGNLFQQHWISIFGAVVLVVLKLLNISYFDYEAEYEIVHIVSKPILESFILKNHGNKFEFPKRLVYRTKIKKGLFQDKLVVYIKTNHGVRKAGEFHLSGISKAEAKKLLIEPQDDKPKKAGPVKLHSVA